MPHYFVIAFHRLIFSFYFFLSFFYVCVLVTLRFALLPVCNSMDDQ